jgi:hypothetical protein
MANQLENLEKRRRYAWAKYFREVENRLNDDRNSYYTIDNLLNYRTRGGKSIQLPKHLVSEIETLHKELKKNITCPICLTEIETRQLKISYCGHKYCNDCFQKIDKCAVCKKPF